MSPVAYTLDQHRLPASAIDPDALRIVEKLRAAGFAAYIVGGGVRDLLMGQVPKDFDIATSARPGQVRRCLPNCLLIGRRFRLAHVRFGAKIIEVSTFRSGASDDDLIVRDNQWGTAQEDVLRRDFTINGLFYDAFEQRVLDYVGGFRDLKLRVLRTIGDPHQRFRQDPVRMLRLLKFRARFELAVDPKTHAALIDSRLGLRQSSPARILEEMMRMLESGYSRPFYSQMIKTQLLGAILPELQVRLEGKLGEEVLSLLGAVDRYSQIASAPPLSRQALFCCLLFPILECHLAGLAAGRQTPLNASELAHQVRQFICETLHTFALFPRKLFAQIAHILQHQFRMGELAHPRSKSHRALRQADFPLALEFLGIRTLLRPALRAQLSSWKAHFDQSESSREFRDFAQVLE